MFVSGWKWRTRKIVILFPLTSHLMKYLLSARKIPIEKEKKAGKKERKKTN